MMILRTRKEQYLNEIVGNGNTAPGTPYTREELFFADILGEVNAPVPVTRIEIYLAKIANKYSGEMPEPKTRIEKFIARAAGMEIETPTPITREEMFWADYALIVEKELSGIPPLTFKAIAGVLKNYRIYGQTENGESVGDRTGNLFDNRITIENGTVNTETGADSSYQSQKRLRTSFIGFLSAGTYTINADGVNKVNSIVLYSSQNSDDFIETVPGTAILPKSFTLNEGGYIRIAFSKADNSDISPYDISNIMLNAGSEALSYEPYGYKVPVTVSNGADTQTIPIYLTEQIKKVGDEAEYIDYGEQKQHRVRKNLLQNTATSQTINGVTFTVNSDGSVVCDGQASPSNADLVNPNFLLPSGTYILTGCPNGGSEKETYKILLYINGAWRANDKGSGINFTLTKLSTVSVRITVYNGYTCDNLTFYPMIRKSDIEDDTYEPYITNTELDVTLPALPTLSGTNTLTVGTEVQPSNVYIKYEGAR